MEIKRKIKYAYQVDLRCDKCGQIMKKTDMPPTLGSIRYICLSCNHETVTNRDYPYMEYEYEEFTDGSNW